MYANTILFNIIVLDFYVKSNSTHNLLKNIYGRKYKYKWCRESKLVTFMIIGNFRVYPQSVFDSENHIIELSTKKKGKTKKKINHIKLKFSDVSECEQELLLPSYKYLLTSFASLSLVRNLFRLEARTK